MCIRLSFKFIVHTLLFFLKNYIVYKKKVNESKVYLIQDIPGTTKGEPKYNILGAQKYGDIVTLLPEFSQMILSPGPLIHKLRTF